jgi:DivIVA domain-containing protein
MPDDRSLYPLRISASEVARHTFGTARRGYDPDAVRAFLETVAREIQAFEAHDQELRTALAEAEERAAHPVLDQATLSAALGQQSAQVLRNAHDEAARITQIAEESAASTLRDAHQQAGELQIQAESAAAARIAEAELAAAAQLEQVGQEADALRRQVSEEAAALREQARQDGERLMAEARERGRTMIDQAQEARRRVLADGAQRRRALHLQIEQLRAARDQLSSSVLSVRQSVDDIVAGLARADDEARAAAAAVAQRPPAEPPADAATLLGAGEAGEHEGGLEVPVGLVVVVDEEGHQPTPTAEDVVVEPAAGPTPDGSGPVGAGSGAPNPEGADPSTVDALFARIRAGSDDDADESGPLAQGAESGADAAGSPVAGDEAEDDHNEDPIVAERDLRLDPVVTRLNRKLKRVLQDDQNRILDRLRSATGGWSEDVLLPEEDQRAAYSRAAGELLAEARAAGVAFAAEHGGHADPVADDVSGPAAESLAATVTTLLRRRLTGDDGVPPGSVGDEAADRVGAAYREWRGERIERLVGDHALGVFSAGVLAAAGPAGVRWVTGGGPTACADCDDNALGGLVAAGAEFPTGHRHPPAHTGCRCVVVPTSA